MKNFIGNWKITKMEQWDQDYIDLVEPGYIELRRNGLGEFVFGTVNGDIDFKPNKTKDKIEFSWEGTSEYDPISGRGWLELEEGNALYGMIFIHKGDESWIRAVRNK